MSKKSLKCCFYFLSIINMIGLIFYIWGEIAYNNDLAQINYIKNNVLNVPNGQAGIDYL